MSGVSFCVWLFANYERELGKLEAHVGTVGALDCFISAGEFAPNERVLKHLSAWLDQEERFLDECSGMLSVGSRGDLRNYALECARHARERLNSMEQTVGK